MYKVTEYVYMKNLYLMLIPLFFKQISLIYPEDVSPQRLYEGLYVINY